MASTLPRPVDDDDDDGLEPDRPWEDAVDDARLTEAELAAAAGVQPPSGRID